jgi:hypothetical protein
VAFREGLSDEPPRCARRLVHRIPSRAPGLETPEAPRCAPRRKELRAARSPEGAPRCALAGRSSALRASPVLFQW